MSDNTNHSQFPSAAPPNKSTNRDHEPPPSSESPASSKPQGSANNMFPLAKKVVDAPPPASQPVPNGMFPSSSQQANGSPNATERLQSRSSADLQPMADSPPSEPSTAGEEEPNYDVGYILQDLDCARQIPDEFLAPLCPEEFDDELRLQFYGAYRMRSLNKAMEAFFGSLPYGADVTDVLDFYRTQREKILATIPRRVSKRKSADEDDQEDENPSKRSKPAKPPMSSKPQLKLRAEDSENQENENPLPPSSQMEPPKAAQTMSNSQAATTPKISLSGTNKSTMQFPSNAAPASPTPPAPLLTKGKRKAAEELTKDNNPNDSPLRQFKTPKTSGATFESNNSGSNTSNIFKNILDNPPKSPTKTSPRKVAHPPATANSEGSRANPFAGLPASPTKSSSTLPSTAPSANFFAPKAISTTPNMFSPKPLGAADSSGNVLKPPTFAPVNFMAQFGQKALKDEEANEKRRMEEAKEDDMDSDEDEAEWEAKYKAKRAAEKKEIDEIAKSKLLKSMPGGGFAFTPAATTSTTVQTEFDQTRASPMSFNSATNSQNPSRTPTPGPFGSSTGSVLDGHAPGKPVSFGNNIFSHLSGSDSGKGNDADDESGDEEDEAEVDLEKKDPSCQPGRESTSGPGTPFEETGVGIASAKKTNFGSSHLGSVFGVSSNSGASTPGRSLFDRIDKDEAGNPIREISTEEKENTQPSTGNIFANIKNPFGSSTFSKTAAPADQTWKLDSPIRFGSTTPNNFKDSVPTVNITAATPIKAGSSSILFGDSSVLSNPTPFSTIFGNGNNTSSSATGNAPSSGLFGNLNSSKTPAPSSLGFIFGASSNNSSLFPSAAGSATTSRATSPGGTTDGESGVEGDPDAEHHEQIDLTASGAGEEDENIVHEVRAKALKFSPKEEGNGDNPWQTKGLGPLRVLKHKDTKAVRLLLRGQPAGNVVLNKALLGKVNYEATGKTVKLLTASDSGNGLETWILQAKTPELANELAKVLEENKPSS